MAEPVAKLVARYKDCTEQVISELMDLVSEIGYILPDGEYISISTIIELARICGNNKLRLPKELYFNLEYAISLRSQVTEDYKSFEGPKPRPETNSHEVFTRSLKKVMSILYPGGPQRDSTKANVALTTGNRCDGPDDEETHDAEAPELAPQLHQKGTPSNSARVAYQFKDDTFVVWMALANFVQNFVGLLDEEVLGTQKQYLLANFQWLAAARLVQDSFSDLVSKYGVDQVRNAVRTLQPKTIKAMLMLAESRPKMDPQCAVLPTDIHTCLIGVVTNVNQLTNAPSEKAASSKPGRPNELIHPTKPLTAAAVDAFIHPVMDVITEKSRGAVRAGLPSLKAYCFRPLEIVFWAYRDAATGAGLHCPCCNEWGAHLANNLPYNPLSDCLGGFLVANDMCLYKQWHRDKMVEGSLRLKFINLIRQMQSSIQGLERHPLHSECAKDCEISKFKDLLQELSQEKQFTIWHQSPTVAGSQTLVLLLRGCILAEEVASIANSFPQVLHVYNFLVKTRQMPPIELFERLCNMLEKSIFLGNRPTEGFQQILRRYLEDDTKVGFSIQAPL
jgi:hypothetical protein